MTVGSYEAKTHLSALLDRILKGEEITITRHGVPVARLVPVTPGKRTRDIQTTIDALRTFRKGNKLNGLSLRDLISEGRR
ncbi:MAG: type II toxin-antitoxin system Phd/YefM family antitoxin [Planctomycetota bacterium]|jgi:prevent-host-death family protein